MAIAKRPTNAVYPVAKNGKFFGYASIEQIRKHKLEEYHAPEMLSPQQQQVMAWEAADKAKEEAEKKDAEKAEAKTGGAKPSDIRKEPGKDKE